MLSFIITKRMRTTMVIAVATNTYNEKVGTKLNLTHSLIRGKNTSTAFNRLDIMKYGIE